MLLAVQWVVDALAVHAISLALPWTSRSISQQFLLSQLSLCFAAVLCALETCSNPHAHIKVC